MDLLGSIMSKMERPPTTTTQAQRDAKKRQVEAAKKMREREKEMILKFRKQYEEEVQKFMLDDVAQKKALPPMDEVRRSIVHEVAEVAGLVCHAFGEEGVDRHIMLFKKEYELAAAELAALRRGEEYDPVKAGQEAFERDLQERLREQEQQPKRGRKEPLPPAAFLQKRQHMFADDAAKQAPVNLSFGVVASSLKTDKRSIEETLADIRANKKRRQQEEQAEASQESHPAGDTASQESPPDGGV